MMALWQHCGRVAKVSQVVTAGALKVLPSSGLTHWDVSDDLQLCTPCGPSHRSRPHRCPGVDASAWPTRYVFDLTSMFTDAEVDERIVQSCWPTNPRVATAPCTLRGSCLAKRLLDTDTFDRQLLTLHVPQGSRCRCQQVVCTVGHMQALQAVDAGQDAAWMGAA